MAATVTAWDVTYSMDVGFLPDEDAGDYRSTFFSEADAERKAAELRDDPECYNIAIRRTRVKITNPEHPLYVA